MAGLRVMHFIFYWLGLGLQSQRVWNCGQGYVGQQPAAVFVIGKCVCLFVEIDFA